MERKLSSKHEDQIEHISEDCESFEWGLDEDCTCGGRTIKEKRLVFGTDGEFNTSSELAERC